MPSSRNIGSVLLFWGGLNGFLAVALGAFGAHALKERLETNHTLATWQTGSQYHLIHAVALTLLALLSERLPNPKTAALAGRLFLAGIVIFSGSLYLLSVTGTRAFGAITPLGGVCFLIGWALVCASGIQNMEK